MDVTCPRCQTDYEFDDALVSERGTTVKCTNCGHQFRVFRPRASITGLPPSAPEPWRIDRGSAGIVELHSLAELQRAIRAGKVSRMDVLRRGDGPPRRLGDITELEPFFPSTQVEAKGPTTMPLPTITARGGVASPPMSSHTPAYGRVVSHIGPPVGSAPASIGGGGVPMPTPLPMPAIPDRWPAAPATNDPMRPMRSAMSNELATPQPESSSRIARPMRPRDDDEDLPATPKGRGGAWLIALLGVVGVSAIAATVGRPYLSQWTGLGAAPSASIDPDRLSRELTSGGHARDEGDFASAEASFLKATAIDESSIAAWDGLCEAQSESAMTHWVTSLSAGSSLERDQGKKLGVAAGKSCARWAELSRSTDEGRARASADLRPAHALATQGDGGGVRIFLGAKPNDPMLQALALLTEAASRDAAAIGVAAKTAELSLAKVDPATFAEPSDVAVASLCAALNGDATRARTLADELGKRAPHHPLVEPLRQQASAAGTGVVVAGKTTPTTGYVAGAMPMGAGTPVAASSGGVPAASAVATVDSTIAPAAGGLDARTLDEQGSKAMMSGDPTRAELLFRSALAQHAGDVDALYGLGQIARARADHATAIADFKQVLDHAPSFIPARLALADEQWATGDHDEASKNYATYLERVTAGSGADRARARSGAKAETP